MAIWYSEAKHKQHKNILMNDQKQQLIETIKSASNILVTVSANPSVDQLAACIGLTLLLNKSDKHATAVFSGQIPDTISFLNPDKTIEKTTDSLRDFIISLDKSKADKLRYKVEDDVVRVFITPYGTTITEKDLVFSQGDFNVDVIIGLGVHRQQDLDSAIMAHGRILHDASVVCINNTPTTELGTINWLDLSASSLSELVATMADDLGDKVLDEQNATALLTGIVAETHHFGNEKTTPQTMTVSARLLEAGANQRLVADKLSAIIAPPATAAQDESNDGSLDVRQGDEPEDLDLSTLQPSSAQPDRQPVEQAKQEEGSTLDSIPEEHTPQLPPAEPDAEKEPDTAPADVRPEPASPQQDIEHSLQDLEKSVEAAQPDSVDDARKAVEDALKASAAAPEAPLEPLAALNAQPVDLDLDHSSNLPPQPPEAADLPQAAPNADLQPLDFNQPLPGQPASLPEMQPVAPAETPVDHPAMPADFGHLPVHDRVAPEPMVIHPTQSDAAPQPAASPFDYAQPAASNPAPGQLPVNPAANEPAPLGMSPADQAFTMPLPPSSPPSLNIPPPQTMPPTSVNVPPQGPPPPPAPPPMMPPTFGS